MYRPHWLFRVFSAFLLGIAATAACAAPQVTGVRVGEHTGSTRFVMDISDDVGFRVFTLPDPYRVVVDLPELEWNIPIAPRGQARGLVEKYRFGLFQPGTSRLVLDLTGPVEIKRAFMLPPQGPYKYRFVLDLETTDRASFMAAQNSPPPLQAGPVAPVVTTPQMRADRVVVIDAGHGGVDPGTISKAGNYEKDVTLRAAKALQRALEARGRYKVILTRDRDIFVPLGERVEIGRRAAGDLFISMHADAIANPRIRGATVYTLSETSSDKEAAALARKENKADIIAGVDLGGESAELAEILIDLMQRETMNYSAEFANMLIPNMGKSVLMRTNSHRFAGFRVLKAPDVPSVLVEMGYLSNADDAKFLTSAAGVEKIAKAVAAAVDIYFERRDARLTSP